MSKIVVTALLTAAVTVTALYFIIRRYADMALVYVSLIIKGRRTYSSVPQPLKAQVREILIDLELEYLIDEDEEA